MKQVKPCPFECNANDCKDCGAYTYSHHTQTNEEWFCGLSTEEKAEWLIGFAIRFIPCELTILSKKIKTYKNNILEWLKQPLTNE